MITRVEVSLLVETGSGTEIETETGIEEMSGDTVDQTPRKNGDTMRARLKTSVAHNHVVGREMMSSLGAVGLASAQMIARGLVVALGIKQTKMAGPVVEKIR